MSGKPSTAKHATHHYRVFGPLTLLTLLGFVVACQFVGPALRKTITNGPVELAAELDRIESDVTQVSVPYSYAAELYDLRLHISHIRDKLQAARSTPVA